VGGKHVFLVTLTSLTFFGNQYQFSNNTSVRHISYLALVHTTYIFYHYSLFITCWYVGLAYIESYDNVHNNQFHIIRTNNEYAIYNK